jgi:transposase
MAKRNMFVGMDFHKAPARRLRFVYEASPCEFGIHGYLTKRNVASRASPTSSVRSRQRGFAHPRHLMTYLGLVPSEYSRGASVRRGGITKAGNPHARRLLAEAARAYHGVARI